MKKRGRLGVDYKLISFIGFILILILLVFIIMYFNLYDLVDLKEIRSQISSYGFFAPLAFIIVFVLATIFLVPTTPFMIMGGVSFGLWKGAIYGIIGGTIGAIIAFIVARILGGRIIERFFERKLRKLRKLKKYNEALEKHGLFSIAFMRIIPLFPFGILNYALGLTKMKFKHYVIGTFLGLIPAIFLFAYFGDAITDLNTTNIIISIILLILFGFSYKLYDFFKKKYNINNGMNNK